MLASGCDGDPPCLLTYTRGIKIWISDGDGVSLAIAQAAKETGWGTSRFALKGNALFGQWTWSGEGLKPKNADEGKDHKVMKFHSLQLSVRAYLRNLNTHSTYKNLRKARTELRNQNKNLDSLTQILSCELKIESHETNVGF
mgnify:CR=1 FL=1